MIDNNINVEKNIYKEDYEYQCYHFEEQIMRIV